MRTGGAQGVDTKLPDVGENTVQSGGRREVVDMWRISQSRRPIGERSDA